VADGTAADDLRIDAAIVGGGSGTGGVLTKNGTGLMALTNVNTYLGKTTLNFGILDVRNGFGLGNADGTTNNDTTVTATNVNGVLYGPTLRLNTGGGAAVAVGNEALTLNGALIGSGAATADGRLISLDSSAGTNCWLGPVTLANGAGLAGVVLVNVAAGSGLTLAGAINQAGTIPVGLTFSGTGAKALGGTAANSYRGTTTVEAGTLTLSKAAGVAAIPGNLMIGEPVAGTGAVVTYAAGSANQLAPGAAVAVLFNSTLNLTGNNDTYAGLTLQSGSAQAATVNPAGGTITLAGNLYTGLVGTGATGVNLTAPLNLGLSPREINVADGAALNDLTLTGAVSGVAAATLTKQNAGTLVIPAGTTDTYVGATTVNQGRMIVSGTTAVGSAFAVTNGAVANGAILGGTGTIGGPVTVNTSALTVPPTGGTLSPGTTPAGGLPNGTPGLLNTGSLTLTSSATYLVDLNGTVPGTGYDQVNVTGTVTLGGSVLSVTLGAAPPSGQIFTIINNDGVDAVVGTFAGIANGATIVVGGVNFRVFYTGGDGNDVVLIETTSGPTVYVDDSTNFNIGHTPGAGETIPDADLGTPGAQPAVFGVTAFSTLTDAITAATAGGLIVVNAGTYPEAANINKTLTVRLTTGANVTVNALDSIAGSTIDLGANVLTVGDATATHTIAGSITGTGGSVVKVGAGSLTLSGSNGYTGGTTVNQGTLVVANAAGSATGSGAVAVNTGGTLVGTGTIGGAVTVNNGGTLAPGNPVGTLTVGSATLNAGSTLRATLNGTGAGQFSQLTTAGTITLVGGPTFTGVLGYSPVALDTYVILHTLGTGAFTGTFAAVPGPLSPLTIGGQAFTMRYGFVADGDGQGNDVRLARDTVPTLTPPPTQAVNEATATSIPLGTLADSDAGDQWSVTVSWGDGSPDTIFTALTAGAISQTHTYADGPNSHTVTVTATDLLGASAVTTFTVNVNNVAPTVSLTGAPTVAEGTSYSLTVGGYADPGPDTPTALVVNWGDGFTTALTPAQVTTVRSGGSVIVTHTYADGATNYTITASVADEDGSYDPAGTRAVAVTNVAPTVSLVGVPSVGEGSLYSLSVGGYTEPGTDTPTAVVVNWGDGGTTALTPAEVAALAGGGTIAVTHTYAGPGVRTVTAAVTDEDGTFDPAGSTTVAVTNVAPSVTISGPAGVPEGASYSLTVGPVVDPGGDTVSVYLVHWGDGFSTSVTAAQLASSGRVVTHQYADGTASFPVTIDLTDANGSYADRANPLSVAVTNVAPTVSLGGTGAAAEGALYVLTLSGYTDPGSDTPTAIVVSWGDGGTTTLTPGQVLGLRSGGSVVLSHQYADGTTNYTITAAVTDEDGTFDPAGTAAVTVADAPPTVTLGGPAAVAEGSSYSLTLSGYADPGTDTPTAVVVNWGDGATTTLTPSELTSLVGGGPVVVTHAYADGPGAVTIAVDATDEDGTHAGIRTRNVTVTNVAPTLSLAGGNTVAEGSTYTLTLGGYADPGTDTPTAVVVNWGDGSTTPLTPAQLADLTGGTPVGLTHTFPDGTRILTVTASAADEDGAYASAATPLTVVVTNVAPAVAVTGATSTVEGALYTLTLGAVTDPGTDTVTGYVVHWGDGATTSYTAAQVAAALGQVTHRMSDGPSAAQVVVDVIDEDGTFPGVGTPLTVAVANAAPTLTLSGAATVLEGTPYVLSLSGYTDPGADTPSAIVVSWGDGTTTTLTASQRTALRAGGTVGLVHSYPTGSNLYTVTASVTDEDGTFNPAGTTTVGVNFIPPTLAIAGATGTAEGSSYTLTVNGYTSSGSSTPTAVLIHWGDGSTTALTPGERAALANGGSVVVTHTFADGPNAFTVTADVTDSNATVTSADTQAVSVTNVVPGVAVSGSGTAVSDIPYVLTLGAVTDPGADTVTTYTVHWGDGSISSHTAAEVALSSGQVTHNYADLPATYSVTVDLTDEDGTFLNRGTPLTVRVMDAVPVVTGFTVNGTNSTVGPEGQSVSVSGTFTDPTFGSPGVTYTAVVNWGDGTSSSAAVVGGTFTATHTYADDNPSGTPSDTYPVTVTVSNSLGGSTTLGGPTVTVNNTPPVVSAGGSASVAAGTPFIHAGSFVDSPVDSWTATVDYGDGSGVQPLPLAGTGFTLNHTFGQTGTFTVTVRVTDDDTGVGSSTFQVAVANVAPILSVGGNRSVRLGRALTLSPLATFVDANFGPSEVYTYAVNWGDGTAVDRGTATVTTPGGPGQLTAGVVNGSHTYVREGTFTVSVTLTDRNGGTDTKTFQVTATLSGLLAAAEDGGGSPVVHVYDVNGIPRFNIQAYAPGFTGGVRVAVGDVDGDGTPDVITAAGPGGGPHIQVFSGIDGHLMRSFFAYAPTVIAGIWVAAGDVDGDGYADIITGAGAGGGPHVQAFSGRDNHQLVSFFAYAPTFSGGVTVAAGDVDGDGRAEIVTGAGFGGGPHVQVFGGTDARPINSFFAYEDTVRNGIFVGAGDMDGDGRAEVVTGPGYGGSAAAKVFDALTGDLRSAFFAFPPATRDVRLGDSADGVVPWVTGVRVATMTRKFGNTFGTYLAAAPGANPAPGQENPSVVRLFDLNGQRVDELLVDDLGFHGGIFVGGV
jgi:autotransporter-associated beta strand protein